MISRYADPGVDLLWGPESTYSTWLLIEKTVLDAQRQLAVIPADQTRELSYKLHMEYIGAAAVDRIVELERTTKHDVAAFLAYLRERLGDDGRWIHFGLTSSDIVDTTLGMRFKWMQDPLLETVGRLYNAIDRWSANVTPVLGRTHGQSAEPTSLGARATHWKATLEPAATACWAGCRQVQRVKLSGPMGTFAHNPVEVEALAAQELEMPPLGAGASQIAPRAGLAAWASAAALVAAACAKVATDVRLMNMLGEVYWEQTAGQVGSSAMAHKNNPIVAEQVCGLATMAQGYASMLQPLSLWLERDLSHSCVERVAVPDLWHVLLHVMRQTTTMLNSMRVDAPMVEENLWKAPEAWVHVMTLEEVGNGTSLEEARASAMIGMMHDDRGGYAPEYFTRQYPPNHVGSWEAK